MNAKELLEKFIHTYRSKKDMPYIPVWGPEGKLMSTLKKKVDDDLLLMRAIELFLSYPAQFWGVPLHTVFTFSKCINSIMDVLSKVKKVNPHLERFDNVK